MNEKLKKLERGIGITEKTYKTLAEVVM